MASTLPRQERRPNEYTTYPPLDPNAMRATRHSTEGDRFNEDHSHFQSPMELPRPGPPGYPNGNGAVPMSNPPPPQMTNGGPRHGANMSLGGFEGPRSPPAAKNTSHVPCKFFRSGQCQAGKACPFSHSLDVAMQETPCKYFAKGNCKFGHKCALAHIYPDGRRANRPNAGPVGNAGMGPRVDPQGYQQADPMLLQSLLAQQANGVPPPFNHQIPTFIEPEPPMHESSQSRLYEQMPARDTGYGNYPDSKYGSPREDSRFLSLSPSARLSVLDAPLPASFDSQGISYMARHGPVAASLPSKIGLLESPPASLPRKAPIPLDSVSNVSGSGFAARDNRGRGPDLGSSPFGSGDEGLSPRFMHSRRQPRSKLMSTSMPRVDIPIEDSDDDAFQFSGGEEDYIPTSIHDQVFTRDEQQRRNSRSEQDRRNIRESLSGIGTPNDPSSKVGSPTTGSPSRYGPLFARQSQQQQESNSNMATSPSAFGHIGSPLRNPSLQPGGSPSLRTSNRPPGDVSPSFPSLSSPPRQSSMSALSQQLSRTRISSKTAEGTNPGPTSSAANRGGNNYNTLNVNNVDGHHAHNSTLPPNSSNTGSGPGGHRNVSGGSQHSQSRSTDRIEEEHADTVFSMEDDFDEQGRRTHHHHHNYPHPANTATIHTAAVPTSTTKAGPAPAWSAIAAAGTTAAKGSPASSASRTTAAPAVPAVPGPRR